MPSDARFRGNGQKVLPGLPAFSNLVMYAQSGPHVAVDDRDRRPTGAGDRIRMVSCVSRGQPSPSILAGLPSAAV
jgi:hypothetical protein